MGVEGEDVGSVENAGAVSVLYDFPSGISRTGAQLWHQGRAGVEGDPEEFDEFGSALAAADFGLGGTTADLAVGVPNEDHEQPGLDATDAGAVNVLNGSASGLSATNNYWEWQDSSGFDGDVESDSERDDYFGSALTAGNFGRGTVADLAVGVRGESREPLIFEAGKIFHVGAVNVLYGDPRTGLRASDDQFWWQASDSLHNSAEEFDLFGDALPG